MKLSKLLAAVATIAIVSEITRRIATEIEYRRMDAELFGYSEEDEIVMNYGRKPIETPAKKAERIRKEARQALLAEQDYELQSLSHALSTQDDAEQVRSKARLAEINTELEALK